MASTSETGHAKNVANFEDLISFCKGYETNYKPSKATITIAALIALQAEAQNAINVVTSAKTAHTNTINARQNTFEPIRKLATRIINALEATDASDKFVRNAKAINKKMQGRRVGSKAESTPREAIENIENKTISTSQQSYDGLVDTFAKFIDLVNSEPTYRPNETELQIATLTSILNNLKAANTAVITAYTNYSNAMIKRNEILYEPITGLIDTAGDVKKYIKSVFGATSPQFKQVTGLQFRKAKK